VFEAEGVCPVYCGPNAHEQAVSYARQRAGYGRAEIQVLDETWDVMVRFEAPCAFDELPFFIGNLRQRGWLPSSDSNQE